MSYSAKGGHGYGNNRKRGCRTISCTQKGRSEWAKKMDSLREAKLAKTKEEWMKNPARSDWPDVDTPKKAKPEPQETVNPFANGQPIVYKAEKPKIKVEHKTKEETKMTYLERAHLLALTKKYGIDRAEIDHRLSYDENKEYLERIASANASNSQTEMDRASIEADKWAGAYKEFMNTVSEDDERWKDYF